MEWLFGMLLIGALLLAAHLAPTDGGRSGSGNNWHDEIDNWDD